MADIFRHNPTLSTLSPVQIKVILALAQGATVTKAAQAAGIHRSTVYDWMDNDPSFEAALRQAADEYTESLRDSLADLSVSALGVVQSLLQNPETRDSVRLRAALAVLRRPRYPRQAWALSSSGEDRPCAEPVQLNWCSGNPDEPPHRVAKAG